MARIPPKILKASIKTGSVYYFRTERLSTKKRHFFVVLNANPQTDDIIVLTCAQSDIQNTKRIRSNSPTHTLIIITPEQYDGFTVNSIIDCNVVFPETLSNIMKKYEQNELRVKPEMDIRLVRKIKQGIIASRLVSPRIKKML